MFARGLLSLVGARFALAVAEVRAQQAWVKRLIVLAVAAGVALLLAVLFGFALLFLVIPEPYRISMLAAAFGLACFVGLVSYASFRSTLRHRRPLFSLTKATLASDLARLSWRAFVRR